ncbi:MAG: hypothetical protein Q4G40_04630 [Brachybacterium sp.]|nr:hypothetical protein [Brachybacterium sp.]
MTRSEQPAATLWTGVVLYSTQDPEASALVVEDGVVAWIGPEDSARTLFSDLTEERWEGSLLTPTFVDVLPTADGTEPSEAWHTDALTRGVTAAYAGTVGDRGGVRALAPGAEAAPYLDLTSAGTALAFGSLGDRDWCDPWSWVRAAAHEGDPAQRISDRAAFLAATRGGRRLGGEAHPGSIVPGVPATFAVWEPWDLTVRGQDERIQTWSTDPRSRTPMLPDLGSGSPRALHVVVDGQTVYDAGRHADGADTDA